MGSPFNRTPFTGDPNRMDFLFLEKVIGAQNAGDLQGLIRAGTALSPGSLTVIQSAVKGGYACAIYDFDAGFNYVSILGTQSAIQLVGELVASTLIPFDGLAGKVSAYFTIDLAFILTAILNALNPNKPVVVAGHSLGGATAQLLAAYLQHSIGSSVAGVFTIGSPKAGDAAFAATIPGLVTRLENLGDIVPSIPQAIPGLGLLSAFQSPPADWPLYVHAGFAISQDFGGGWENGHTELTPTDILAAIIGGEIPQHFVEEYQRRTMLPLLTPGNLVPFAQGFEKPWQLFNYLEQPQPPGTAAGPGIPVPAGYTNQMIVSESDRSGDQTPLGVVDDPPPRSWVPDLVSGVKSKGGCVC